MHTQAVHIPQRRLEEYSSNTTVRSLVVGTLGFLVTTPAFKILSANQEAVTILTYPGRRTLLNLSERFEKRLRRNLLRALSSNSGGNQSPSTIQFKSGRRTYFCRAFVLDGRRSAPKVASVLVVLERGAYGVCTLSEISHEFHLTQREQEMVTLLIRGLGNKEIAERLGISVNTVKTFLRLVMIKMGVGSRSRIVSTVLGLVQPSKTAEPD